ncbi:hypothetical protein HanIR_Chr17g0862261 [Helianthus annuus]|nr:hypothetical protein HanIR_Chr17g0862261 [Helianthus annuus]
MKSMMSLGIGLFFGLVKQFSGYKKKEKRKAKNSKGIHHIHISGREVGRAQLLYY